MTTILDKLLESADEAVASTWRNLSFSEGWSAKLTKRDDISSKRVHSEAASVPPDVVREGRAQLLLLTREYERREVFNMDGTAFVYWTTPAPPSRQRTFQIESKQRSAFRSRCAATPTDNQATTALRWQAHIGPAQRLPRLACEQLDDHRVVCQLVGELNERLQDEERSVLLLVNNVSSHRYSKKLPKVSLKMLPSKTTSALQPQASSARSRLQCAE